MSCESESYLYSEDSDPWLKVLTPYAGLYVQQEIEYAEVLFGLETENKYVVGNMTGQTIFRAEEDSNCCTRNCCVKKRPFKMKLYDRNMREVLLYRRYFRCQSCCFPCCLQRMDVFCDGRKIGSIRQEWSICYPHFGIRNGYGEKVLHIRGPFFKFSWRMGDVKFNVFTRDRSEQVGFIKKRWSGILKEYYSDADNYSIQFPVSLNNEVKALLLGAVFLIDFMWYERRISKEERQKRPFVPDVSPLM